MSSNSTIFVYIHVRITCADYLEKLYSYNVYSVNQVSSLDNQSSSLFLCIFFSKIRIYIHISSRFVLLVHFLLVASVSSNATWPLPKTDNLSSGMPTDDGDNTQPKRQHHHRHHEFTIAPHVSFSLYIYKRRCLYYRRASWNDFSAANVYIRNVNFTFLPFYNSFLFLSSVYVFFPDISFALNFFLKLSKYITKEK